jgi:hypothetical protein
VNVYLDVVLLCRLVTEPQRDPSAQASPSRTRSPNPKVVVEALTDDAQTTTPPLGGAENRTTSPLVADLRVASPARAVDVGEGGAVGDV